MKQNGKFQVVYSSESAIRRPIILIKSMLRDLWNCRGLAYNLMTRDIKASYRQSFLGFFWAFIPTIVTAFTFAIASQKKVLNIGTTDIPYLAYVLFNVSLWRFFSESVMGPISGLSAARSFITKIKFEHEALFIAKFGEAIFGFGVKCILIAGIFIYFDLSPSPKIFLALLIVFCLLILGQAIGLLLAPFNIIYNDIAKGIPLVLGLGMFITPVVYPMPSGDSLLANIVRLNPLTYLITAIRELSVSGTSMYLMDALIICICSVLFFIFSWIIFRLAMPYVIER